MSHSTIKRPLGYFTAEDGYSEIVLPMLRQKRLLFGTALVSSKSLHTWYVGITLGTSAGKGH